MNQALLNQYPAIADLAKRARKRIPYFAWEYLDSGTGTEGGVHRNIEALSQVSLTPQFMKGPLTPHISTELFGIEYGAPFGVAPVGLTGLMWPEAEKILARTAAKYRIPYGLSTVATETPETIGPIANGMGWFQLYPPNDPAMRLDLLTRAKDAGFTTVMVTADTPAQSRRERQKRADVSVPPRQAFMTYYRAAIRPAWALATLSHGMPRFRTMEKYAKTDDMAQIGQYMNQNMGTIDWAYLEATRREWSGTLLIKGLLDPEDARRAVQAGVDGVIVSNHGARQFDGGAGAIEMLPGIVEAVGDQTKVLFDSGVRGGLDVCRALALGADFVLLGRAFMYAVAALGQQGGDHAAELLIADLQSNMANLGCANLSELPARLAKATAG
ncbi:MAG: alpha-hydroxy acid oxidase [Burkholderiaceae bacterium]